MTLDELTTPWTRAEVEAKIYAALATRGVSTTGWKPGAVVRTIIVGVAIVLSGFSQLQALIAKSGFLELSEGDWLTLVARYVYGVERDEGSFATGTITLNNAGGNVYAGDPDDLVFSTVDGRTYRNTAAFAIGAFATGVVVPIQAVELGSAGTASAGTITQIETALLGVSCTNAASVVGTDAELDPALRTRCNEKTGTLSPNGARDAYSFVARSTKRANGESIGVTRVRTVADGYGGVTVYVATATGAVESADVALLQVAIDTQVVPLGVTATVVSAAAKMIAPTYELWVRDTSGKSDSEIGDAVAAKLTAFMSTQPIGGHVIPPAAGKVYVSALETVIGATLPDAIIKVQVTLPAADVDIAINEAPVLGAPTVTDIHQVAGGII